MTLSQFESRLKKANSSLRIKRYGTSYAAIFYGNAHLCRIPQGEITAYSVVKETIGTSDQFTSPENPLGLYKFDLLERRGRHGAGRILLARGVIKHRDLAAICK